MPTWSTGIPLRGANGLSVLTGSGAPASTLGVQTQAYIDLTAAVLYVKTANGWPSSGTSLVGPASTVPGPQGLSVQSGSGAPANTLGNVGDLYIDTTNGVLYAAKTANGYPTPGKSLVGPASTVAGPAGSVIYSATGSPPNGTGIAGDYFYSSDTYIFYGPKPSATSWTNATQSNLKGIKGDTGASATGTPGADGKTIRSGSAAPTSSTTANVGDFYIQTSTPYTIYGPATAANTFPTPGVSLVGTSGTNGTNGTNGNTIRNGTAAPSASTPSQAGDFYLQTGSNPVLYGPSTGGAGTYPSTGVSLVGPSGSGSSSTVGSNGLTFNDGTVQTTAYPGPIALSTNAPGQGPACWVNGTSLTSTAINMFATGTSNVQNYVPPASNAFYFVGYTVYSNTANNVFIQLYNLTDGSAVWTSPSSIAPGTVGKAGPFAINTYPMTAGKNYVWRVSGNGASYVNVYPMYFMPSSAPFATQLPAPAVLTQPTTLSSTAVACKQPGTTNLTQYYQWPTGVYFSYAVIQNFSTATAATFVLYNNTTGAALYTSASVAAGASLTVGPLGPGTAPLIANNQYIWNVTGSGSATVAVNWQVVG